MAGINWIGGFAEVEPETAAFKDEEVLLAPLEEELDRTLLLSRGEL